MNKPILYISIGALIAFLLSAIIVSSFNLINNSSSPMSTNSGNDNNNAIFASQTAVFEGTISERKDNSVTLKNSNNISESFPVAQNVQITKFTDNKNQPTVSNNINDIETNKRVSVILRLAENTYEVVNISYIPEIPQPELPPQNSARQQSTQSANPR